jgi:hypothetical protein
MRKEIELVLYEIKHGIFPQPFEVSFEEYILIEEAVKKKKKDFELLYSYMDKWSKLIA